MTSKIPDQFDKSDPNNLKIMRIEGDLSHFIEIPFKGKVIDSKILTNLILYFLLQEKIQNILDPPNQVLQTENLLKALSYFKSLLKNLIKENKSEDANFAEQLSTTWKAIIAYENFYIPKLKKLIDSIDNYPDPKEHTLGLYLKKFIGEKWLPLPFIEILTSLHEEALISKEKNHIKNWIDQIDEIILANGH